MRIRQIKPEFWKHEGMATVKRDARLLFIGLLQLADGWGLLEDRPKRIRAELFPYDDDAPHADFQAWLDGLVAIGVVERHTVNGTPLLWIPSFRKHQLHGMHKEEKNRPSRWKVPTGSDVAEPPWEPGDDQGGTPTVDEGDQGGDPPENDERQGGDQGGARVATGSSVTRSPSRGAGYTGIRGNGGTGRRGAGVSGKRGNGAAGSPDHPGDQGGGSSGEPDPRLAAAAAAGGFMADPKTAEVLGPAWLEAFEQLTVEQVEVVFAEGQRLTGHEIRYPTGFAKALKALRVERKAAAAEADQREVQRAADERKAQEQAVQDAEAIRCRAMLDAIEEWFLGDGATTLAAIQANPEHAARLEAGRKHGGTGLWAYLLSKTYPELARIAAEHSGVPK